jgi:hypothetical protein
MGFFIGDFVYRHHHAPSEKAEAISWLATRVNINVKLGLDRSQERYRFIGHENPDFK